MDGRDVTNARRLAGVLVWLNIALMVAVLVVLFRMSGDPRLILRLGYAVVAESWIAAVAVAVAVWMEKRLSRESKISLTASLVLLVNLAAIVIYFAVLGRSEDTVQR